MWSKLAQRSRHIQRSEIREVTRQIEAVGGINLGQGTCALRPCPQVLAAACEAVNAGHNSYTLFDGIESLKESIVKRYAAYNKLPIKAQNVLVTCGATGALESICKCFLETGDEVILFEPVYQYHVRQIIERGAIPRYVQLRAPNWSFDPQELEAAFTEKTKLLIFSNPNNPCGKVFNLEELEFIGSACRRHDAIAVSDEVYEYILGEEATHLSLASLPGMFDHTLTISSASKTLFVTGWRIGWLIGPEEVMEPLGVKSDETYVCAPAPLQHAVASALALDDDFFNDIRRPFQRKRKQLGAALVEAGLRPYLPEGAYYILADYTALGFSNDFAAMNDLIKRCGVGSVPGNAFFPSLDNTGYLRFCFAVTDAQLDRACELLVSQDAVSV
jgi:aminotransferase